jgi:hypothetical protein
MLCVLESSRIPRGTIQDVDRGNYLVVIELRNTHSLWLVATVAHPDRVYHLPQPHNPEHLSTGYLQNINTASKLPAKHAKTYSTLPGFEHWLSPLGPSGSSG